MNTDILIIGGGLAGLALAARLEKAGRDWNLIEATNRLGGRIYSPEIQGQIFDLGPTWFWHGQPRMRSLIDQFNLPFFEQFSDGMILYEDQTGRVHANHGFSSMQGSLRIAGGMESLIVQLSKTLPQEKIHLGTALEALHHKNKNLIAKSNKLTIHAQQAVLALPPRVIANNINFKPFFSESVTSAMTSIPTWMAGQAKILAVYDKPYWREKGFSGDAMSLRGPLVEIHDASPVENGPYALFGFVGVPPEARSLHRNKVIKLAKVQLASMFGPELEHPLYLDMQDWAEINTVATNLDQQGMDNHPAYGQPQAMKALWNGRLHFGSTEMSSAFGGYLEGALEVAENVYTQISTFNPELTQETA